MSGDRFQLSDTSPGFGEQSLHIVAEDAVDVRGTAGKALNPALYVDIVIGVIELVKAVGGVGTVEGAMGTHGFHRPADQAFGTLAVGSRADLIMLGSNPLESMQGLDTVVGLVVRGEWHAASDLRDLRDRETDAFRAQLDSP